jgi:hypothetical protein
MKSLRWMAAIAALASCLPAQAATTDPEVIIYRVAGVSDSGGAGQTGHVTAFFCTNFSGVTETVRIVVRNSSGPILANQAAPIPHLNTASVTTRLTVVYGSFPLNTGSISQGTAAIAATSTNVTCTVLQVDAAASNPIGIALHLTRFNPAPGTQE